MWTFSPSFHQCLDRKCAYAWMKNQTAGTKLGSDSTFQCKSQTARTKLKSNSVRAIVHSLHPAGTMNRIPSSSVRMVLPSMCLLRDHIVKARTSLNF
mmetsp:Transcript_22475/g.51468  ORF Transcript_22475/g.51468 Transcript_22475/m.51468 type:complete len:97 (-) Transcript_22475:19-309(-)